MSKDIKIDIYANSYLHEDNKKIYVENRLAYFYILINKFYN